MNAHSRFVIVVIVSLMAAVSRADVLGEGPALGQPESRISQSQIEAGGVSLHELRGAGLRVFGTRFNQHDGYGDGPMNPADPTALGGRPTLGGNGTYLRVNGLDAQACNDCHGFVSTATVPPTLGVGGSGGLNNAVMFMPRLIDVGDAAYNGFADFDGRLIVPPSLFGAGGIQLLAAEMTAQLQGLRAQAQAKPGLPVALIAKGIDFGVLVANADGTLDVSAVTGIDADLVVRPFGRKGEFATVRAFDQVAMMFHFGIEPEEVVGAGVDADGDGVVGEILPGDLSALEIFITTQDVPRQALLGRPGAMGFARFMGIGCGECHVPELQTDSAVLQYAFPEVPQEPYANVFFSADLSREPTGFQRNRRGGLIVRLFGDLKRHDMGYELGEQFQGASEAANLEFLTAELWGVADSSPYLHDGRALTLNAAILAHGGEAQAARDAYVDLNDKQKSLVIGVLRTLRSPDSPNADVLDGAAR